MTWSDGRAAVVVGAGLAGLASAIALREAGWDVVVLERRADLDARGAGIVLHPNALGALERLGALDDVRAAGATLRTLTFTTGAGATTVELDAVWSDAPLRTVAVSRSALAAALRRRVAALGVPLRLGVTVKSLVQRAGGVTVRTGDGETRFCDLVVACDGVRSRLRAALVPAAAVEPLGVWWARWIAPAGLVPPGAWRTCSRGTAVCGAYALGTAGTHVFLQRAAVGESDDLDAVVNKEAKCSPLLLEALAAGAELIHAAPGFAVRPHCWSAGSVAFAGDAAHALSPTMSEGGGLALEDGVVLGEQARHATSIAELLAGYRARRAGRVAWAARMGELQLRRARQPKPGTRPPAATLSATAAVNYLRAVYRPLMEVA